MLSAARNGVIISPANDAKVTICPTVPRLVLNVIAISARINPIRIPIGLVDSWEMNNDGIRNLFSLVELIYSKLCLS